jgi:hypothetical protein
LPVPEKEEEKSSFFYFPFMIFQASD